MPPRRKGRKKKASSKSDEKHREKDKLIYYVPKTGKSIWDETFENEKSGLLEEELGEIETQMSFGVRFLRCKYCGIIDEDENFIFGIHEHHKPRCPRYLLTEKEKEIQTNILEQQILMSANLRQEEERQRQEEERQRRQWEERQRLQWEERQRQEEERQRQEEERYLGPICPHGIKYENCNNPNCVMWFNF